MKSLCINNGVTQCLRSVLLTISLLAFLCSPVSADDLPSSFESSVSALAKASFKEKEKLIPHIVTFNDPRTQQVLELMLGGDLFYQKKSLEIVTREKAEGGYLITNVLTGDEIGVVGKRKVKKVKVNNKLRSLIKGELAKMSLFHNDRQVRLNAVNEIVKSLNKESVALLVEAQLKEQDQEIQSAISVALALINLESDDKAKRLDALTVLSESVDAQVKASVEVLLLTTEEGEYLEADAEIRNEASKTLKQIEGNIKYYSFLETLFFGLSLGSVLLLAAIGLAITFGVMGVINMAHGELIMIGAYTTYVVQLLMPNHIDYSLFVAIPAAFIIAGLVGVLIERGVIQFLYGRPLETLLATFGISLILQQLVRTIFSPLNRSVETPSWMSGAWEINSAFAMTYNRLYIIIFSILVFLVLLLILKKTVFGLQMRAVTQNREMARAMGVRSGWVDAMTFGLGAGIAGIAGVALSQLTNVGPNMGQAYIIDSFMVVVFGGVGNLWGTLVAAFSLGVVNKFLEPWVGAVLAKILVLIFIILFIQKRPRGLFPQKGRHAEN